MIAVCLLTSGRADYTERTLRSFEQHNPHFVGLKLHADDGSVDDRNLGLAQDFGFKNIYWSGVRQGGVNALRCMWNLAAEMGTTRILHLENDFEWVAPLPDISWPCVRLYGALKGRDSLYSEAAKINLVNRQPVTWRPHTVPGWEQAHTHFGGPPSVIDIELLLPQVAKAKSLKEIGLFTVDTIRPVNNMVWHIGAITTRLAC